MRIAIVGGTGAFGKGLTLRWSIKNEIFLGSRSKEKAEESARLLSEQLKAKNISALPITGLDNREAILSSDLAVLCVKYDFLPALLDELGGVLENKIIISPVVPMVKEGPFRYAPPAEGSAAMKIQRLLPDAKVVSCLHTIPANHLQKADQTVEGDVPVCGGDTEAKNIAMELIRQIPSLNPLDAGPLEASALTEALTPLIMNLKQYSLHRNVSIQFK